MSNSKPLSIVLTHTAKSKSHRYYTAPQLKAALEDHRGPVYYDRNRGTWLVPTIQHKTGPKLNHEREETVVVILDKDEDTFVVVTQTGDHYNWSEYVEVDSIGERGDE